VMRMSNERDQEIVRAAVSDAAANTLGFVPSLGTREAFASREARFQDAPDLCFGKLQRELVADPGLLPGPRLVLTTQDLLEYRNARDKRPPVRTRRVAAT